ncbi:hypothetical protein PIB30_022503, partial [Stylosanthes scabra]|nr:hypothetical protein [Stylosanthes scabra]
MWRTTCEGGCTVHGDGCGCHVQRAPRTSDDVFKVGLRVMNDDSSNYERAGGRGRTDGDSGGVRASPALPHPLWNTVHLLQGECLIFWVVLQLLSGSSFTLFVSYVILFHLHNLCEDGESNHMLRLQGTTQIYGNREENSLPPSETDLYFHLPSVVATSSFPPSPQPVVVTFASSFFFK